MEWFSEWFDSPYYHILYKNRDLKEAETFIDNLTSFLQLPSEAKVIDMPCGKGRHAIYLNKKGYTVSAADLSPENIRYAKSFENEGLKFYTHDMREQFAESEFDAFFNIFTSFGYFEDSAEDIRCIEGFKKALKPGGKLVIDFLNVHKAAVNILPNEVKIIDSISFSISKKIENKNIIKTIEFSDKGICYKFTEKVAMLYKEDFLNYFNFAELKNVVVFGNYNLEPFDPETSDRLILIAEK